ncbi:MAG: class I SAM-dependent methyltransferase [Polyangiales bacterium]
MPARPDPSTARVAHGDWQTPPDLARRVVALLRARGIAPAAVLEPTCGRGAFVAAALDAFPAARVVGYELSEAHLADARAALAGTRAELHRADFFSLDWDAALRALPDPLLVVGNPPWVTSATQGAIASGNLPAKSNFQGHRGLDAVTGRANFDISEAMLRRLLGALHGRAFTLAVLYRSSVARHLLAAAAAGAMGGVGGHLGGRRAGHFDAAVDAVLLAVSSASAPPPRTAGRCTTASTPRRPRARWAWRAATSSATSTPSPTPSRSPVPRRSRGARGSARLRRRDGLRLAGGVYRNGLGDAVDVEPEVLFPLRKGSDVANGRAGDRSVIVTQRATGDDTTALRARAPRAWAYLEAHRPRFEARRSSIYRGRAPFAMFGVGAYSFAPYKVATCGLYKRLHFTVVGPEGGRPVMLDDTSYFLPCEARDQAEALAAALNGPRARRFFEARVFWDAKRPVSKALLGALSLDALLRARRS